jgi:hypothetical protein
MTKKNAKKSAARARQEAYGGKHQHHLRQVGGAGGGSSSGAKCAKYLHLRGGFGSLRFHLSDDAKGAVLRVDVPEGPLTPEIEKQAFAAAAYPLIIETRSEGETKWTRHESNEASQNWGQALNQLYRLAHAPFARFTALRIRARSEEELLRHPPKQLEDLANVIRARIPTAEIRVLDPVHDNLHVRVGRNGSQIYGARLRTVEWPLYVTPVPDSDDAGAPQGSFECLSVEDVFVAVGWAVNRPSLRLASVDEMRAMADADAGRVKEPLPTTTDPDQLAEQLIVAMTAAGLTWQRIDHEYIRHVFRVRNDRGHEYHVRYVGGKFVVLFGGKPSALYTCSTPEYVVAEVQRQEPRGPIRPPQY